MALYPTEQWLEEYERRLDESEALDEAGAGWGVTFDGSILVVITDVPVEETTVGDLPEEALAGVPEFVRDLLADVSLNRVQRLTRRIRWLLPEQQRDLLRQLEQHIVEDTIHAFIGLEDGSCTEVDILTSPAEREVGFVLRGSYETWRQLIDGELPLFAMIRGDLEVGGSRMRLLQYFTATQLLGEIAANVETTHLFPRENHHGDEPGVVEQSLSVSRFAFDEVNRAAQKMWGRR